MVSCNELKNFKFTDCFQYSTNVDAMKKLVARGCAPTILISSGGMCTYKSEIVPNTLLELIAEKPNV